MCTPIARSLPPSKEPAVTSSASRHLTPEQLAAAARALEYWATRHLHSGADRSTQQTADNDRSQDGPAHADESSVSSSSTAPESTQRF
jgi:hypothetical protein